ncbi:hypothetical protein CPB86DRAFT_815428 [Serendipita vermifera]|nr:hypothetical protein CPB86DRAFT_815428 [Serendipita vermifera]
MVQLSSFVKVALGGAVYAATTRAAPSPDDGIQLFRRLNLATLNFGIEVSQGCQSTLTSLLGTPASSCLNLPGTVAVLTTVANSSWIPPINTWLTNFCSAELCTDDQLSGTISIAADACSNELTTLGVTKDFVIQQAIEYFPVAKQALCLRDQSDSNNLCTITTLEKLETALGGQPLSPDVIINNWESHMHNDTVARQVACTPCMSAAYSLIKPSIPEDILVQVESWINYQCGADYTASPTGDIAVVTGTDAVRAAQATATPTSGATTLGVHGAFIGAGVAGLMSLLL